MHVMGPHENKRAEGDYMQLEKNCMVKERAFHLFFYRTAAAEAAILL